MSPGIVWYEIISSSELGESLGGSASVRSVEKAEAAVGEFARLYPHAYMIFVRQHLRNGKFRLVHRLTWKRGMPMPQQVFRASWRTVKRQGASQ